MLQWNLYILETAEVIEEFGWRIDQSSVLNKWLSLEFREAYWIQQVPEKDKSKKNKKIITIKMRTSVWMGQCTIVIHSVCTDWY